jgi:hypothetical protein
MRTKTLLLTAAAIAAGFASSMAQNSNVYSLNLVGWINVPLSANTKALVASQLDDGTNTANSILAALPNKSTLQTWNGSGFVAITKAGGSWPGNPGIAPGSAFFISSPSAVTNPFIGSSPISNSVNLSSVKVLVGARIPFSGFANDSGSNSINLGSLPNKSVLQTWSGTAFTAITKASNSWPGNPAIAISQGFFISTPVAATWNEFLQ